MTLEEFIQPSLAGILTAGITGFFALNAVFITWLMNSFSKLRHTIEKSEDVLEKTFDTHEVKDQARHEENLYRFERISVALARLGSTNGTRQ